MMQRQPEVVLDELHFETSLYMYKSLEAKGLELRLVKHRDWAIDRRDMERAIDRNTRLVSMALVSNVNGYLHDARAIADFAHAHGAFLYADMVQGTWLIVSGIVLTIVGLVSVGGWSGLTAGVDPGLIFSFPSRTEGGVSRIVEGIDHDEFGRRKLAETLEELRKERDAVEELGLIPSK